MKKREALENKSVKRLKGNVFRNKTFLPNMQVTSNDRFDVVFINTGIIIHDRRIGSMFDETLDNIVLDRTGNLRVWNNRGQKESMRFATFKAENPNVIKLIIEIIRRQCKKNSLSCSAFSFSIDEFFF